MATKRVGKKMPNTPRSLKPKQLKANNQAMIEALELYGSGIQMIFTHPSIISSVYYNCTYKLLDPSVKLLTDAILCNHFDQNQENIICRIVEDCMTHEFEHTQDMTTYLRENTSATKMLAAYLKRAPIANFVDKTVQTACDYCLQTVNEDLEIDPNAVLYLCTIIIPRNHHFVCVCFQCFS